MGHSTAVGVGMTRLREEIAASRLMASKFGSARSSTSLTSKIRGAGFCPVTARAPACAVPQLAIFQSASFEAPANFISHLLTKFLSAGLSLIFGDIESLEYVKIIEDRVTITGHHQDTRELGGGAAWASDFWDFCNNIHPKADIRPGDDYVRQVPLRTLSYPFNFNLPMKSRFPSGAPVWRRMS